MEKEKETKKNCFASYVKFKVPTETGMMFTFDKETLFCSSRKHQLEILVPHAIFPMMRKINYLSGSMLATKEGKLHMKVCVVDGCKKLHMSWPVKYCVKANANLFSLTCELL